MLYLVGLGLGDTTDITVKGLEVIKQCSRVYLESYTAILTVGKEALEEFYGKEVTLADRETVEQEADEILKDAGVSDVAFLVVGDPFGATTHTDLVLRAAKAGIPYRVIHNASIMNAVGCCGLQLYNFGETISIVFWTDTWRPESFYDKIKKNRQNGMHTLCLLDLKVKEQSVENLMKGRKIFEPPRYMSVNQAAEQLLEIVQNRRDRGETLAFTEKTICVGLARVGANDQKIAAGTLVQMASVELGGPLHCMVITGHLHPLELDMLKLFALQASCFENLAMEDSSTYSS
ncbi:diphthine methyl ester synthase [Ambystoma mexicanum]|uniref:diphthine methyl ester synthase n=1 Tax=Ambystoma mexicanum TaxID=8296 RepID=UPI0037E7158F